MSDQKVLLWIEVILSKVEWNMDYLGCRYKKIKKNDMGAN